MGDRAILILTVENVLEALDGRESEVIEVVRDAYLSHHRGQTRVPRSVFLRFRPDSPNRIIGLPAYLADEHPIAGLKWIASFPANTRMGIDRASAVLVLNSLSTGRPVALLESSIISARRTAAGAALAAQALHGHPREDRVGVIGCGLINFEILRFLRHSFPALRNVKLFDIDGHAMERFADRVGELLPGLECRCLPSAGAVVAETRLVSLATVATEPHIDALPGLTADSTVLHVSLRDLAPAVIRSVDNVVDDPEHVFSAGTSLGLTEAEDGNRHSVRCSLAEVLSGEAGARVGQPLVFSPFGLGVLDLAVARLVLQHSRGVGRGVEVADFLPRSDAGRIGSAGPQPVST